MFDYEILFRFYNKFLPQGFLDIDRNDPLVLELEEKLEASGQFIHVADMINFELLFVSCGCEKFYGVSCERIDPAFMLQAIHPEDEHRNVVARSRVFKIALEMYESGPEELVMSSNFRTRNASGNYVQMLYQVWMKVENLPHKAVYQVQVNTDITGMADLSNGYHFFRGFEKQGFHYPDEKLLLIGPVFSDREMEVLECIAQGLDSHEIAEKLFISIHTVNTHRRNILNRSGKRTTHELVLELKDRGVL